MEVWWCSVKLVGEILIDPGRAQRGLRDLLTCPDVSCCTALHFR